MHCPACQSHGQAFSVLESIVGSTLLHPTGACESGTNWTCGAATAAWRAWVTAVLIAAIISRVSCPSSLGPGGLEGFAVMPEDLISSHQQDLFFSFLLHVPDKVV